MFIETKPKKTQMESSKGVQNQIKTQTKSKEKGVEKEYEGPLLTKQGNSLKCLVLLMMKHAISCI